MKVETIVVIFGIFFTTVAEQTNSESEESGLVLEVEEPQKEVKISKVENFINRALPQEDDSQEEKKSLAGYYIKKAQVPPQKADKTEPKISKVEYDNKKTLEDDKKETKMSSDEYNINKAQVVSQKDDIKAARMSNVEYYIKKAKTVVDKANELIGNTNFRRDFSYDRHTKFTDFLQHLIKILKLYEDKDLEDFVGIVNDEIRKYHYRGCKFHEVINNHGFRRFMSKKLDVIKTMTAADIRHGLKAISAKLEQRNYSKMEKELVDFINSLYKQESVHNFNTVLINVDNYRTKTRRTMNLIEVLRDGIRSVIFDHFTDLNTNARMALKTKVDEFWDYLVGVSASFVMQHYLNKFKLSDHVKIFTDQLTDEKVESAETTEDPSSVEYNIARKRDENREQDSTKHTFINNNTKLYKPKEKKSHHIQESSNHINVPTTLRQMYVESVNNNFSDSKMRLSNKKHLRNLNTINKDKDYGKKKLFLKLEYGPTTLRQMYLKKIEAKYNTQAHIDSVEFRSKDADYINKIQKNSMQYSAKPIERPATLRQLYLESMDLKYPHTKYQQNKDKYSANFRSNDKYQNSNKRKHIMKSTDDPTTLRQMFLERFESKHDSQFMKLRSKDKKFLDLSKINNDATTLRQIYLESIELNNSSARNTKTNKHKSKINTLIDMKPLYKVLYSENMQHLVKSTDEPSTPRRVQVEIMNLQYGPRDHSTELMNKGKITSQTSGKGNKRVKNKLRHRKNHNHTKFSKEHKKHNMYIDLDSKFLNQRHFQLKTTKNIRTLRQRYLETANDRLTAAVEKDKGKVLETGGAATRQMYHGIKEKLTYTNKSNKYQIQEKKGMDLRIDKKLTLGNPTTMNIIEEHNAIIKINKVKTPKPRRISQLKHKTSNKELIEFSPVYNTIPRRQTLMDLNIKSAISGKSKIIRKPLKTTSNTSDHKLNITADTNISEEGLSIEELKYSNRRMDSNDPGESLLNDTAVLTKIRQLENELKVVKTKLENDTEIIENLNTKICETENRLKEFCNQEFKIVRANRNIPVDDRSVDSRADINGNDEKALEDENNEYNPKRFQIARSRPNQDEVKQSKKQFISNSNSNKHSKDVTKQMYKDTNNVNDTSNSDDESTADIPEKTMKTEADIDGTSTKGIDIKTNSVSIIDKLTTIDDITTESDLNKNINEKVVTAPEDLRTKEEVNSIKEKRDVINDTHAYETGRNELNKIENNKGTFRQNSEALNSKQTDSDTDHNNNVHMINKNDYSGENDNYYKTESKNRAQPKLSRKGNIQMTYKYNAGQYMKDMKASQLAQKKILLGKGQFRMEDDDLRRELSQDIVNQGSNGFKTKVTPFIGAPPNFNRKPEPKFHMKSFVQDPNLKKQLKKDKEDEKKEERMLEIQRMINNPFDKDGVMMDIEQMPDMQSQLMFEDMPNAEADPIAQWLNVTSTKAVDIINANDNPFKDIDGVLGRLAKEKVRRGR